jgi:hypothetical protein
MVNTLASLRATPYKVPKGTAALTLTCGHTALYVRPLPAPDTDAFCRDCRTWRHVRRTRKPRTART